MDTPWHMMYLNEIPLKGYLFYIMMWFCPGNMPKYYPGLRDILPGQDHIIILSV